MEGKQRKHFDVLFFGADDQVEEFIDWDGHEAARDEVFGTGNPIEVHRESVHGRVPNERVKEEQVEVQEQQKGVGVEGLRGEGTDDDC